MRAGFCEVCHRAPAGFSVYRVSKSGLREERNLCEVCAKDSERIHFGNGGLLMAELLQVLTAGRPAAGKEPNRTKVCPSCGNTVNAVEETGVVGCSMCFMVFREEADRVIKRLHGMKSFWEPGRQEKNQ